MTRATARDKWRRRSRQEWQGIFARFAGKGLGVEPFCTREGISKSSFRRWLSVLNEQGVPVTPEAPAQAVDTGFVDAGLLKLGGGRLELKLDLGDGVVLHLTRG
ncbi:IS66 family insertion sequence element accessory protein TnpA [Aromatoleum aromaticum]|uniref:IS66 family insertion sequence element accessory protein TnpA n=1 Tax=Aromatoleum aromaticum TaxID=551760 RepID=UPI001459AD35|nr:IS66 family insertion sequence element accessory protein TnpB [Aromatoleum aromaticum]NMG56033.1 IS66 family insertion sequence element accessory protein TnpB [Aromatoleum aromaticum]